MAALVADYGSESSDNEEDDAKSDTEVKTENVKDKISLIPADVMLEQVVHGKQSSVFANPFLEEEKSQHDSLEKHVKMTNCKDIEQKQKKNICYKFQKGKCTFGDKCKYYHPTTLFATTDVITDNIPSKDEDDDTISRPKKKRYGLKDNLDPPKGYVKMYNKQKKGS